MLRFGNAIFEPIWNRRYVDHVQITVSEDLGVGTRGGYYDKSGALRDIVQNHMLQVLSIVAMEPPAGSRADDVRDEKVKVLRAIPPFDAASVARDAVRGQYGPGWIGGERVPGYREEQGVDPASNTDTFVAMRVLIDNWRWSGTPFYLRTGKRLPRRATEVAIQFKPAPHLPFATTAVESAAPNLLILRIQPDEGASLRFLAKVPGPQIDLRVGQHGLRLRQLVPAQLPRGVRAPAARRPARRLDALRPLGRGGAGMGDHGGADRRAGRPSPVRIRTTRRGRGAPRRPTR